MNVTLEEIRKWSLEKNSGYEYYTEVYNFYNKMNYVHNELTLKRLLCKRLLSLGVSTEEIIDMTYEECLTYISLFGK